MARPAKKGLEYSPQDVDIHSDRKIRRLLNEFGATGYLVYDYIKCLCFKENGYWIKYDDGFCFDVADTLKCGITENSTKEILMGCFRMCLFNQDVFNAFQIITSKGIQERYLKAKRSATIDESICLINNSLVIATETTENEDLSTQSKVKEIIKESKEAFKADLQPFLGTYGKDTLNEFFRYWSEASKSGKLKWQMERTWELSLRLKTWHNNKLKWK